MSNSTPLSFEFDGIVTPDMDQQELYSEMEQVCLNVLDGFNSSIMTFGPSRAGKTFTMLGDVGYSIAADSIEPVLSLNNFGVHLRAARQIFSVIEQRSDRYKDTVTFTILEVHEEKLCDLLVGTDIGESQGIREMPAKNSRRRAGSTCSSSSAMGNSDQPLKLELKTNHDGETCVSGLIAVELNSFEDVCRVWKECLSRRVSRLAEQGIRLEGHDHNCHTIGTMRVSSANLSTGSGTHGKIQFVDFAASDVVKESHPVNSTRGPNPDMPSSVGPDLVFENKSIATLSDVVQARSQFQRSVPYRNSTITHLLSDSLEADTKVVMIACVSSDVADIQETACTLKFAQSMRKVIVGKATTHSSRANS
jgi:kinesin family protein C2/C3